MISNLPNPKLRSFKWRWLNVTLLLGVLAGFVCGFARYMPDFMLLMPTGWLLVSLVWGQVSDDAKALRAPPFIPPDDPSVTDDEEEDEALDPAHNRH
jgi:hypothetical protein